MLNRKDSRDGKLLKREVWALSDAQSARCRQIFNEMNTKVNRKKQSSLKETIECAKNIVEHISTHILHMHKMDLEYVSICKHFV